MARTFIDYFTLKWANATQGRVGQPVKQTTATACDLCDNINLPPLGVLINEPRQNEMASIVLVSNDKIFKGICGETILVAALVGVRGSTIGAGKFANVSLSGTYVTTAKYIWGVAVSPGVANEEIEIWGFPQLASLNEVN